MFLLGPTGIFGVQSIPVLAGYLKHRNWQLTNATVQSVKVSLEKWEGMAPDKQDYLQRKVPSNLQTYHETSGILFRVDVACIYDFQSRSYKVTVTNSTRYKSQAEGARAASVYQAGQVVDVAVDPENPVDAILGPPPRLGKDDWPIAVTLILGCTVLVNVILMFVG